MALGERDCSTQRRNQKVIEETPAPNITQETRTRLCEAAVRIGKAVGYRSAGTVEFLYDNQTGDFFFLEVNTRLQVEHGVTEEVTGFDLVEWMVLQASGDLPPLGSFSIVPRGHSFEARLYAEDAGLNFQPSSGRLTHVSFPAYVAGRDMGGTGNGSHALLRPDDRQVDRSWRGSPPSSRQLEGCITANANGGYRDEPGLSPQSLRDGRTNLRHDHDFLSFPFPVSPRGNRRASRRDADDCAGLSGPLGLLECRGAPLRPNG